MTDLGFMCQQQMSSSKTNGTSHVRSVSRELFVFFSEVPFEERVFTVLKWLQLPEQQRLVLPLMK